MMSCITEFHVCYIEFTQFAMVWNSNGRVVPTRSTNVGSADFQFRTKLMRRYSEYVLGEQCQQEEERR